LHERNRTEGLVQFDANFYVNDRLVLLFSLRKLLFALLNCELSVSKKKVFVTTVQTVVYIHTLNVRVLNFMRKLKQEADKIVIRNLDSHSNID